ELALEPLLDDLEMQQSQEAAAEAESQGCRGLGLELEGGVVEPQLLQALAQRLEIIGVGREEAAKHHRNAGLEARQRRRRRTLLVGDRVADLGVGDLLDAGGDEA